MAYKQQAVSDLAWIFNAPMIVVDIDLSQWWIEELEEKLSDLDANPSVLLDSIAQCKSHFLGAYFEVLFSFAIRYFSKLSIIVEHEQITNERGTTLGEIDMLVQDPDGYFYQFEIAIKYFLEIREGNHTEWIGPNKTDSLSKKSAKARAKQLTILNTDIGRLYLKKWGVGQEVEPKLLIFGYLFESWSKSSSVQNELVSQSGRNDPFLNNDGAHWIRVKELDCMSLSNAAFCELIKPKWMTPDIAMELDQIISYEALCSELEVYFLYDIRPKMYLMWQQYSESRLHAGNDLKNTPYKRVFIVPDSW